MLSTMFYKLNGVPLDTDNCLVMTGSTLIPGVNTRRTVATMPGLSGSLDLGGMPVFDERELTLTVDAFTPKVYAESSRVMRLCTMPNLTLSRVKDGVEQATRVELTSLSVDDASSDPNMLVSFTAKFAMPDVWWHSVEYSTQQLPVNATSLIFPKPRKLPAWWTRWQGEANNSPSLLADFVTMWEGEPNNSPSLLFTDEIPGGGFWGDAPLHDLVLRFPSTVTSITVTDPVSNTGITWVGNADNTKPLYIQPSTLRAWRSQWSNSWTFTGTDVSTGLDYPPNGILQCWPNVDETYKLQITVKGATGNVTAHFQKAWW